MPLTDIQWILGHARLSTTQVYLPKPSEIASYGRETAGQLVSTCAESVQVPDGTGPLTCVGFLAFPSDA